MICSRRRQSKTYRTTSGHNLRSSSSWPRLTNLPRRPVPVRKAYTYVDLTHKDVLPLWMGSEAVGGHTPRPGEFDWDPNADTASLGALGRAFKGAMEKPRYFRNMVQWSAVWHGYATAAVAMEQMTWPMVLSHANQMCELAEEERISGTGPALVFVYDELLREVDCD